MSAALAQGRADIVDTPPNAPARAPASAWRDLRLRSASALVFGSLGIGAMWLGGEGWQGMLALLTVGMGAEWLAMGRRRAMGLSVLLVTGVIYIVPACVALIWMRADPVVGFSNVLFVVMVVWASDIGAYLVGRRVGGPKLAPRISPGKTRSGAVGGLIASMAVGLLLAAVHPGGHLLSSALIAGVIGIASQLGDLLESGLKRYFGVKDSGRTIPGHGGLLDRLDGMLLAAPVAAIVLLISGDGVFWR